MVRVRRVDDRTGPSPESRGTGRAKNEEHMSAESTPEPAIPGDSGNSTPPRAKGRRRKTRSPRSKALLVTAWTAAGIVVLGGTGAGYVYFKLNGNIKNVDINQALGSDRPRRSTTARRTSWSWAPTPAPATTRSSAAAPTTAAPAPTPR